MNLKISRSYLLGVGSGLLISAILSMLMPPVSQVAASGVKGAVSSAKTGSFSPSSLNNHNLNQHNSTQNLPKQNASQNLDQSKNPSQASNPSSDKEQIPANSEKGQIVGGTNSGLAQSTPGSSDSVRKFTIPTGASAEIIADLLLAQGFISNKQAFLAVVNQRQAAGQFRAGDYNLSANISLNELVSKLLN